MSDAIKGFTRPGKPIPTVVLVDSLTVTMTWIPSETTHIHYCIDLYDNARNITLPSAGSVRNIIEASYGEAGYVIVNGAYEITFSVLPTNGTMDLKDRLWLIGNIVNQSTFAKKQKVHQR